MAVISQQIAGPAGHGSSPGRRVVTSVTQTPPDRLDTARSPGRLCAPGLRKREPAGLSRTCWIAGTSLRIRRLGFESLRARPGQRPLPGAEGAFLLTLLLTARF